MRNALLIGAVVLAAAVVAFGCGPKRVSRVAVDTQIDLSGRWNDTDSRLVAEEMIKDCGGAAWLPRFEGAAGRPPVVIVGRVANRSHEHIGTDTFIKDLERAWVNSGQVEVVSNRGERQQLREERADQAQGHTAAETAASIGNETGADFMLIGTIATILDQEGAEKVVFYQVNLELHDLSTNRKVWIGEKKIKKFIERDKSRW